MGCALMLLMSGLSGCAPAPAEEDPNEMNSGESSAGQAGAQQAGGGTESSSTGGGGAGGDDAAGETPSLLDPEGVAPGDTGILSLEESRLTKFGLFTSSPACAQCHSNHNVASAMRDESGAELAPFNLWRGSMMANAARDPFWWAQTASEVALSPDRKEEIEGICMRCHTPMLSESARLSANREARMSDLLSGNPPAQLGLDGVACTACHQILPTGLGTQDSFTGGFIFGRERKIFGPHEDPAPGPMLNHVDYRPTYATHVTESALCATCHTLLHDTTSWGEDTVDDGQGSLFPEQTPYLEWRNSTFNTEVDDPSPDAKNCQGCHQPTYDANGVEIETRIARSPPGGDFLIDERKPFGQHTFVGANAVMPQIIKAERATLKPQAPDAAFDMITEIALDRLSKSVVLEVRDLSQATKEGRVEVTFKVKVKTASGHKFPTGFPARRAWLVAEVLDAEGEVAFRSGGYTDRGRITDGAGALLDVEKTDGGVEPHHDLIEREDQVQIYQAVMRNAQGKPTQALTLSKGWLKDNRILPRGYSLSHPDVAYTRPVGVDGDESFIGGQDEVTYRVLLPEGVTPASVKVKMVYQTLGARFMRMLFQTEVPEVAAFRTMYERAEVGPTVMFEINESL
jgi:hypothetical protein